ncbi:MAG: ubiquinone biosynthesis regulatory protein kinase UbiB [Gammaproteobacteria bacterium]
MISVGQLLRLLGIQRVLIRHGLDEIILATHLFRPVRFLLYLLPWNWTRRHRESRAKRLLHVLEDLGPVFVKFGQFLSTRRDLLPDDIADEFSKLQDSVPPFHGEQASRIIAQAYGHPLDQVFAEFDQTPLASASIAQVHAASLKDGKKVVVKVVRPDIEKVIRRDLGLIRILADLAERYWEDGRRLRPTRVVVEYHKIILDELDLIREAANASQLKRNFSASESLYVPGIVWDLTRRNVMVMERIEGIAIADISALKAAGVGLKELAEITVGIFFTQVFRDRYFHADMHPGNLFVLPASAGRPIRIAPVDFGIMGSLTDFDQQYLAKNFLAFLNRDYRRVAQLHVESAWVPPDTRVDDFEFAIRTVSEPMFEQPLKEVSFGRLLLRLFQTAQRFHMEILPQLLLLQKTLVNIEGLSQQLYPDLDLWHTAQPWLERWMGERAGVKRLIKASRENVPVWAERLPELPKTVMDVLDTARNGHLQVHTYSEQMAHLSQEIRRARRHVVWGVAGSALVLSAALLLQRQEVLGTFWDVPSLVWVLGGLGCFLLVASLSSH